MVAQSFQDPLRLRTVAGLLDQALCYKIAELRVQAIKVRLSVHDLVRNRVLRSLAERMDPGSDRQHHP